MAWGRERVGWTEGTALTNTQCHVQETSRGEPLRSTRGSVRALWWRRGAGWGDGRGLWKKGTHASLQLIQVVVRQKLIQLMGFSRQAYWSGLPLPSPGDLPNPGIKQHLFCLLHWQMNSLPTGLPGKPHCKATILQSRKKFKKAVNTQKTNQLTNQPTNQIRMRGLAFFSCLYDFNPQLHSCPLGLLPK